MNDDKADAAKIESFAHGLETLDFGTQMLAQVTRQGMPAAMIRGVAEPIQGWINETRALLPFANVDEIDEDQAEVLATALFSLGELNRILQDRIAGDADAWSLYVAADAMQQTTREMLETLHEEE